MLCEKCHENEATIHYTEIINGVKTEHHLCRDCAAKLDLTGYANVINSDFPFVKLLTGLLASNTGAHEQVDNQSMHIRCPQCGMEFGEFINVGKFGCAECYNVFGPLIEDNMKKIQGSIQHKGKVYQRYKKENKKYEQEKDSVQDLRPAEERKNDILDEIAVLNAKLKEAVLLENFEGAAKYRDEIKALKGTKGGKDNA